MKEIAGKDLPQSNASYEGGTNGSMGDAKQKDLKKGFVEFKEGESYDKPTMMTYENSGFLRRHRGSYER